MIREKREPRRLHRTPRVVISTSAAAFDFHLFRARAATCSTGIRRIDLSSAGAATSASVDRLPKAKPKMSLPIDFFVSTAVVILRNSRVCENQLIARLKCLQRTFETNGGRETVLSTRCQLVRQGFTTRAICIRLADSGHVGALGISMRIRPIGMFNSAG